jgi:hypothetical protein
MKQTPFRLQLLDRLRRHRTEVLNRVLRERVPFTDRPPECYRLVRWWFKDETTAPVTEWTPSPKPRYKHKRPDMAIGRYIPDDDLVEGEYFDGGPIEDYEDSTRANRPSDYGAIHFTGEVQARLIDMVIITLRARDLPYRKIGKVLNRSHFYVRKRYTEIPDEVVQFYGTKFLPICSRLFQGS